MGEGYIIVLFLTLGFVLGLLWRMNTLLKNINKLIKRTQEDVELTRRVSIDSFEILKKQTRPPLFWGNL